MKDTIFDNPNRCTEKNCDHGHCNVCGSPVSSPIWGKTVCKRCIDIHHKAHQNGTLTQDDINRWETAFRVTELARSF